MDSGIYIKDRHDGEEIRRAIQISTFRLEFGLPVTFLPEPCAGDVKSFSNDWNDWLDGRWDPYFSKHLVQVYVRSREFKIDEIVKLDRELTAFMDADEAERSIAAGAVLHEGAGNARHHRVLEKFRMQLSDEESGGHAATVFAIQAAAFHLPLFSTLISFLYYEWKSGSLQLPERAFEASERQFTVDAMGALGGIRQLLRKHLGAFEPAACA